jgi:hypothetical protein
VADLRLLRGDRLEVSDLALGDDGEVADLAKPEARGRALEDLDRPPHHLRHRRRAIVAANDPAGDPRCPSAHAILLEEHHLLAAAGQGPGGGQPEHAAAHDDASRPRWEAGAAQLHG